MLWNYILSGIPSLSPISLTTAMMSSAIGLHFGVVTSHFVNSLNNYMTATAIIWSNVQCKERSWICCLVAGYHVLPHYQLSNFTMRSLEFLTE